MSSKYKFKKGDLIIRNDYWGRPGQIYLIYGLGSMGSSEHMSPVFQYQALESESFRALHQSPSNILTYKIMNIKTLRTQIIISALEDRYDKVESPSDIQAL